MLYYEVAPAGSKGKGKGISANASYSELSLNNVANYLMQQQGASGLELTDELQELEVSLWGPPAAPEQDVDELYTSAPPGSSDDDRAHTGGTVSLEFSGLVTEGARGVQRVRDAISERKRHAREAELDFAAEHGGGVDRRSRRDVMRARQVHEFLLPLLPLVLLPPLIRLLLLLRAMRWTRSTIEFSAFHMPSSFHFFHPTHSTPGDAGSRGRFPQPVSAVPCEHA